MLFHSGQRYHDQQAVCVQLECGASNTDVIHEIETNSAGIRTRFNSKQKKNCVQIIMDVNKKTRVKSSIKFQLNEMVSNASNECITRQFHHNIEIQRFIINLFLDSLDITTEKCRSLTFISIEDE